MSMVERTHLDWLESEAIYILREVAGQCQNPVLFFSGGKDSIVLLRWAFVALLTFSSFDTRGRPNGSASRSIMGARVDLNWSLTLTSRYSHQV